MSVGDRPTGCKYTPFSRNGSGAGPGSPAHPTHAASRPAMTGSMAVTSPPGLCRQPLTPSASTTRSTGRRFAATTRSNVVPATVMDRHLPARGSGPAYGPELVSAMSPPGNEAISRASLMSQRASWPRPALPGRSQSDSDGDGLQDRVDGSTKSEGSQDGGCSCAGPPDAGPQPSPAAATRASPRTTTTGQLACSTQWVLTEPISMPEKRP